MELLPIPAGARRPFREKGRKADADESLVPDARGGVRPAEQVEARITALLRNSVLPVSLMRVRIRLTGWRRG
jgi:hypothetical protein